MIKTVIDHSWDLSKAEAVKLQRVLAAKVIREDCLTNIQYVAGVDVAYDELRRQQFAAAVVLAVDALDLIETAAAQQSIRFPYVPGLFSFRELPVILMALDKLKTQPDLIVCDGQGVAHPRRFGLASHLGVLLNLPTIGCAKTKLLGSAKEPGPKGGDCTPLVDKGEIIGCALRTQDDVRPIYVSIGHRISLKTACHWILRLSPRYRLPETTRLADQLVRSCRN